LAGERASRPSEFPAVQPAQSSGSPKGGDASATLPPVETGDVSNSCTVNTSGSGEAESSSDAKPSVLSQDVPKTPEVAVAQVNSTSSTIQNSSAAGGMIKPPDFRASKSPNGQRPSSAIKPPDFKQMLKSVDDFSPQPSERHDLDHENSGGSQISPSCPTGSSPLDAGTELGFGVSAIGTDSRQEPGIALGAPSPPPRPPECDSMATIDSEATQPWTHSSPGLGTGAEKQNRHADPFGEAELPLKPPEFRRARRP